MYTIYLVVPELFASALYNPKKMAVVKGRHKTHKNSLSIEHLLHGSSINKGLATTYEENLYSLLRPYEKAKPLAIAHDHYAFDNSRFNVDPVIVDKPLLLMQLLQGQVGLSEVMVDAEPINDLSNDELKQLIQSLNTFFNVNNSGITFYHQQQHCYISLPPDLLPDDQRPLSQVLGKNLVEFTNNQRANQAWQRFINDMQMFLYTNAINRQRQMQGKRIINHVCCWGLSHKPSTEVLNPLMVSVTHVYSHYHQSLYQSHIDYIAHALGAESVHLNVDDDHHIDLQGDSVWIMDDLLKPSLKGDIATWQTCQQQYQQQLYPQLAHYLQQGHRVIINSCDGRSFDIKKPHLIGRALAYFKGLGRTLPL